MRHTKDSMNRAAGPLAYRPTETSRPRAHRFMVAPLFAVCLVVASACEEDEGTNMERRDAGGDGGDPGFDAGPEAGSPPLDAGSDAASIDGSNADADTDGGGDDAALACEAESAAYAAFVASHDECQRDEDCAIVGSCSLSLGFNAVNVSAREEAQGLSGSQSCGGFDGPTYAAMCEDNACVARRDGAACGSVSSTCRADQELYRLDCEADVDVPNVGSCRQRCAGAEDTACAPDYSCQQTQVVAVQGGCEAPRVERWLCMPKPDCEVVLSLDSAGAKSRDVSALGTATAPLELWAENRSATPKTFTYQRPCPGGPSLTGIGSYDAWNVCAAGACPTNPPTQLTIAPGERLSLGMAEVSPRPTTCNPSGLAAGEYAIGFTLADVNGATVCGPESVELTIR